MASGKEFARRMKRLSIIVDEAVEKTVRKVALAVDQQVVMATPVDTGRARANWIVSLNVPIEAQRDGTNWQAELQKSQATIAARQPGDTVYIVNSVPYIGRLNEGSSAQAPANFVETALMRGVDVIKRTKLLQKD